MIFPAAAAIKKTEANYLAAKFPYACCNMAPEGSLQDLATNRRNERARVCKAVGKRLQKLLLEFP